MPKTVADYEDAVRRITNSEVRPDATTKDEVERALRQANVPQLTDDVIEDFVDAVVTTDKVVKAIEQSGELPSEGEIGAIASVSDDYDQADRVAEVAKEVANSVATIEDVEAAVRERQDASVGRPTFREEVETAVNEVASSKQFVGESPDEVASEQAREIGAPREQDFNRAAVQTVTQTDAVTPSDVIEDVESREGVGPSTAKASMSVIRDDRGDPVAVTGGVSDDLGQDVASELGADFMSSGEVREEMDTEGVGSTVDLTLRGKKVGEVDVE